jgi:hypothetical protein
MVEKKFMNLFGARLNCALANKLRANILQFQRVRAKLAEAGIVSLPAGDFGDNFAS